MTPEQLATVEQPKPNPNNLTPCFALVLQRVQGEKELADMVAARAELGYSRYGTYLQPSNGRCPYVDGLQEALDLLNYLAQASTEGLINKESQENIDKIEDAFYEVAAITKWLMKKAQEKNNG